MSGPDDTVSQWIEGLRAGDQSAATRLRQRYYRRLVGLACAHQQGVVHHDLKPGNIMIDGRQTHINMS